MLTYNPLAGILCKEGEPMDVIGIICLCVAFFSLGYVLGKDINHTK